MKLLKFVIPVLLGVGSQGQAAEVSLVDGFYQAEKEEDGLDSTVISFGGRYADYMSATSAWFFEASLGLKSYSADDNEPDNTNDISIGGGMKYFLSPIAESVIPYGLVGLAYVKETTQPEWSPAATTWSETNGLTYRGTIGFRLKFSDGFFMEIETNLFQSYLGAKQTNYRMAPDPEGKTDSETTHTDLFVNSKGNLGSAEVILGMEI